jgi:uncharacterized Ntn-hydrolase superfamily protein
MTFSITGRDAKNGMLGVAVATKYWAVGARVPYVQPRLAALAVQAYAQPYLGYDTLKLMAQSGCSGPEALQQVLAQDPGREWRQVGLVDHAGKVMGHTGTETVAWSGHLVGEQCVAAGNMLVGEDTVRAMVETFEGNAHLDLPDRLVLALQHGHAAGGDRRGQQSAAVYVVYLEDAPYVDLRVDDHADAIAELARLTAVTREDRLVRSLHFASSRESPPVSGYISHKEDLKKAGLA